MCDISSTFPHPGFVLDKLIIILAHAMRKQGKQSRGTPKSMESHGDTANIKSVKSFRCPQISHLPDTKTQGFVAERESHRECQSPSKVSRDPCRFLEGYSSYSSICHILLFLQDSYLDYVCCNQACITDDFLAGELVTVKT